MTTLFHVPVKRILVVALVALMGCRDSDKNSSLIFEELNESLERSNKAIEISTQNALSELNKRRRDAVTAERAILWGTKADLIKSKTKEILSFVDGQLSAIKETNIKIEQKKSDELYVKLLNYRNDILNVDPSIKREFEGKLPILNLISGKNYDSNFFYNVNFYNVDLLKEKTNLLKLKNNIKVAENMAVIFCNYMTTPACDLLYSRFQGIVASNATKFGIGEEMTITAGIGEFTPMSKPNFEIDGVRVKPNENGVAEYKLKVSNKPGKYKSHVVIKYIAPDGKEDSFKKDIEYTVVE